MKQIQPPDIPYKETFPVRVHYYKITQPLKHWHPETELVFVLSGEAEIFIEDTSFLVQPEDIFLINSNDLHQFNRVSCELLSLHFHIGRLPYLANAKLPRFSLNSAGNTHASKYDYIRHLVASFIKLGANGEHIYKALSMTYALYSHLIENFQTEPLAHITPSRKNRERIASILAYMEDHYQECLTLSDVAEYQNLSVPYFSSFFEKNTGKTFLTYYNEIRLTHAVDALLNTQDSIETIALSNGFNDSRAFVALFKKKYHTLPSTYRKQNFHHFSSEYALSQINSELEQESQESVGQVMEHPSLTKYQHLYQQEPSFLSIINNAAHIIDAGTIDLSTEGIPLRHNFHRLMCVGSAKQFLYKEVQDMIVTAQKEIHYDYVKFHGILSDDMLVYSEKSDGTPIYSFSLVDKIIDFMLSVGLRPLCQLSFMPIALASDPSRMIDMYHYNTSPPKDMSKWVALVDALVRHFVQRYGLSEVEQWLFCVWNEPDETAKEFSWDNKELFFEFYRQTFLAVKAISPNFIFGTPSLLISIKYEKGWAKDFFQYCHTNDCSPDFLNLHYYDNTLFESDMRERIREEESITNASHPFPLTMDSYAFMKFINRTKLLMKRYHMKELPIYLTEWNLTISHRDYINDTCFKACYLTKNLLENYDRLASYGYWCLTDFIEELPIPDELYFGGLGMFTYNGIPKSHYNAFRFLSRLGSELMGKGNGYFITKTKNQICIIIYNYEHYSKLFAGTHTQISAKNRYTPFEEMNTAQFTVQLKQPGCSKCLIKEMFINQEYGSSYDAWVRMGAQPLTSQEHLTLLKQLSQPGLYLHQEVLTDDTLTLHVQLAPLEVRMIEIDFQE